MRFDCRDAAFRKGADVLLVSSILLSAQFALIRILCFGHWFHFAYLVMAMALLGFSAGGTWLAVSPRIRRLPEQAFAALCMGGFALTALLAATAISCVSVDARGLSEEMRAGHWGGVCGTYGILMLLCAGPFVFLSLYIGRALVLSPGDSHRVYALNLAGTACGAGLFLTLFQPLGAYRFLCVLVLLSLGVALARPPAGRLPRTGLVGLALLAGIGVLFPQALFAPRVDASKQIAAFLPRGVVDTVWTPLFRVDLGGENGPTHILIDGDAWTPLARITPERMAAGDLALRNSEELGRSAPFRLIPPGRRGRALVIGAGGGRDVFAAYKSGFRQVDAVDIDPVRLAWLTGKHADLTGRLFLTPQVEVHVADGRAFVRRQRACYDAISLYSVDSVTGLTLGAYNLVENYLYTREAFQDYYGALAEGGILQIARPAWGGEAETMRMFGTFVSLALENGLDPRRCLLVLRDPYEHYFLFSKGGWDPARVQALLAAFDRQWEGRHRVLYRDGPEGQAGQDPGPLRRLLDLWREGDAAAFYERTPMDIRPVTDDRPFFFENLKWRRLWEHPREFLRQGQWNNWSNAVLAAATGIVLLVVAGLIGLAAAVPRPRPSPGRVAGSIAYFGAIGFGYMLVQMTLIQRLALVLGHPVLSMALVIPALMVSMGAGAWLSKRHAPPGPRGPLLATLLAVAALAACEGLGVPLWKALIPFPPVARGVGVALSLLPLGIPLGFCFPLGLRVLTEGREERGALAWTVNGGFSVLGSLAALGISLAAGFHVTMLVAVASYAAAFLAALAWRGR